MFEKDDAETAPGVVTIQLNFKCFIQLFLSRLIIMHKYRN